MRGPNDEAQRVYRLAQIVHDFGAGSVRVLVTWPSRSRMLVYGYDREIRTVTGTSWRTCFITCAVIQP